MDQFNLHGKSQTEVIELFNYVQEALQTEKKYHETLDNLLEGLQILDFDFRYLYVNNAVVKQSRLTKEKLIGNTMTDVYPDIEHTELFKTLSLCMKGRMALLFENEFNYPDSTSSWFELSIQPTEEGLIILSNDITERKKTELERQDYVKSIERVLFMTSHQLRQPVVQFQGLVSLLKSGSKTEEELAKIVSYLEEVSSALDAQTRDITGYVHAMETKAKRT